MDKLIWTLYRKIEEVRGLPTTCGRQSIGAFSEDNKGHDMDKGYWHTEIVSMHISLINSPLEKNPYSELGI